MLEPRWTEPLTGLRFIGGTADFDIWYQPASKYLVLVSGNRDPEWAAYPFYRGKIEGTGLSDDNGGAGMGLRELIAQKKEEVETYIRLFAPDLVEKDHA